MGFQDVLHLFAHLPDWVKRRARTLENHRQVFTANLPECRLFLGKQILPIEQDLSRTDAGGILQNPHHRHRQHGFP